MPFSALLLILFFSASCGTAKKKTAKVPLKEHSSTFLIDKLARQQVKADWLYGKAKISYDGENLAISFNATLSMKKDSILWISLKKLGYEVARVKMTTDSVYVIDRFNKEYYIQDLSYLERTFNIPAKLDMIQNLILGNPFFFSINELKVEPNELSYHLYSNNSDQPMDNHYWINGADFSLQKMQFIDQREGRELLFELKDYRQAKDDQFFSYIRKLKFDGHESGNGSVDIDFSQVVFNSPKTMRFEIPERYTRAD